jgi:hypothetical protein
MTCNLSEEDEDDDVPLTYTRLLKDPPVSRRPRIDRSYKSDPYPKGLTAPQRVPHLPPPWLVPQPRGTQMSWSSD